MKAPQVVMAILLAVGLTINLIEHGKPDTKSFWASLIGATITVLLLWWGGFWG